MTSHIEETFSRLQRRHPFAQAKTKLVENAQKSEWDKKEMISAMLSTLEEFRRQYANKVEKMLHQLASENGESIKSNTH